MPALTALNGGSAPSLTTTSPARLSGRVGKTKTENTVRLPLRADFIGVVPVAVPLSQAHESHVRPLRMYNNSKITGAEIGN